MIQKSFSAKIRLIVFVGLTLTTATLHAGSVTFTDSGSFSASVWNETILGNGDVVDTRELSGGNPNEFIRLQTIPNGGTIVFGVYLNDDATYDPSSQGAIDTIGMGLDVILFQNVGVPGFTDGQAYGIALLQNGEIFRTGLPVTGLQFSEWDPRTIPLVAESGFVRVNPNGSTSVDVHPDFSSSGSLIRFGFTVANSGGAPLSGTIAGYDNWNLTVTPVPEPVGTWMLLVSVAGAPMVRRRNSCLSVP